MRAQSTGYKSIQLCLDFDNDENDFPWLPAACTSCGYPAEKGYDFGGRKLQQRKFFETKFTVFLFVLQNIRKSMEVCYMLKNEEECLKNLFSDLYFWS